MIKWSKLSLSGSFFLHLFMDFRIIWHSYSFETFVQVCQKVTKANSGLYKLSLDNHSCSNGSCHCGYMSRKIS